MGIIAGVDNNLLCLNNFLRGDCDVEGVQDKLCGCGGALGFLFSINAAASSTANVLLLKFPLVLLMQSTLSSGKTRSTGSHGASCKAAYAPLFSHFLISFATWPWWAFSALAAAPNVLYLPFRKSAAACVFLFLSGDAA